MPRTGRASVGDYCYHVINRGNARAEVFHAEGDYYQAFGTVLAQASQTSSRLGIGSLLYGAENSRLTRMLSFRTFIEASAKRFARSNACVCLFMRSIARRIYAALERCRESAHRRLVSNTSSGSLSKMAPMILLLDKTG